MEVNQIPFGAYMYITTLNKCITFCIKILSRFREIGKSLRGYYFAKLCILITDDLVWDDRQLAGDVKAHERTNERTIAESVTPGYPGHHY